MLRKLVTALILVPLAIVLVAFAVANRQTVVVSFDPFDELGRRYDIVERGFVSLPARIYPYLVVALRVERPAGTTP